MRRGSRVGIQHLLGLGRLGEGGVAAQIAEHDDDLASMACWCNSPSSRAFSIAITAWAAKLCNSPICLSENGRTSLRYTLIVPSRACSLFKATRIPLRIPVISIISLKPAEFQ